MEACLEDLDSQAFGRSVLKIDAPERRPDFGAFETEYRDAWNPAYVYVKIPAENLALIHYFEDQGFRFMEFQLRMSRRLPAKEFDVSAFAGVLEMRVPGPEEDIEPVLKLADEIFEVDRVSRDPSIADQETARRRYRLYITKSWRDADEELLAFFDRRDGSLASFHTCRYPGGGLALTFLGGHARRHQGSGLGHGCTLYYFNHWIRRGLRRVRTHISLAHYKVMEAEYKGDDYKPEQAFAVLRKLYP